MKKKLKLVILLTLLMSTIIFQHTYAIGDTNFNNHWAHNDIKKFIENNYVELKNNKFRPNNNMTRGEFANLINNVFELMEETDNYFDDMSENNIYFEDALIARQAGYISGYEDNTFRPDKSISRQEVAKILCLIMELEEKGNRLSEFDDYNRVSNWSKSYINAVLEAKYFNGYPDNTFKPLNNVKRAEAVVILNNIIESEPSKDIYKNRDIAHVSKAKLNRFDLIKLKGASLEEAQSKVNTVIDVLQYFKIINFQSRSGDNKSQIDGIQWSFNNSALETYEMNKGNCGGTSSFVNYLLENDYKEKGYIFFSADGGGHIYNYVKKDGKYYLIDFPSYVRHMESNRVSMMGVLDSLDEHVKYVKKMHKESFGKPVELIAAFRNLGTVNQFPVGRVITAENSVITRFRKRDKDHIEILYSIHEIKYIDGSTREELRESQIN